MKNYLLKLSILSLTLVSSLSYAETPPEGTVWFRPNNLKGEGDAGVSFSDVSTWNEYLSADGTAWVPISMDVLPWELPWASTTQLFLKMDNSTVNADSAIGSADNKPLFRFQLHQELLGFRKRLTHIEIAPCPDVIVFPNSTQTALPSEYHCKQQKGIAEFPAMP